MDGGQLSPLISASNLRSPPTVLQIFQEAARLLRRSRQPMLSILLTLLLPRALLYLASYLFAFPLSTDMITKLITMVTKGPRSPGYWELTAAVLKDFLELTGAQGAIMLLTFALSVFLLMAEVHTVAMAAEGQHVTARDLLCRIRRAWKGPVVTKFYVAVLGACYIGGVVFLHVGAIYFFSNAKGSPVLLALGAVTAFAAVSSVVLLAFLQMVRSQALVMSVVEEGCYGLSALWSASELTRGRRRLGFVVNFILLLISVLISVAYYFGNIGLPGNMAAQLAAGLAVTAADLLTSVFMIAVYVVFYYECRRSSGEEVTMNGSLVYTGVCRARTVDDEALPGERGMED